MEPRREEQPQAPPPSTEQKLKRFRIVQLEERIAPNKGGGGKPTCPTAYPCNLYTSQITCQGY